MSSIDGRTVNYLDRPDWVGLVIGDSHQPGFVRVHWSQPIRQISIHEIKNLQVIDAPPSQEELAKIYHG